MNDGLTVQLACGHLTYTRQAVLHLGLRIYCYACKADREWVYIRDASDGYNFRCTQCRYARSYGAAHITCEIKATSHSIRRHHTVLIQLGNDTIEIVETNQPTLTTGEVPF